MNTFWTDRTAERNATKVGLRPAEWMELQRKAYERMTGVKWSWYTAGGGYQMNPVDEGMSVSEPGTDLASEVEVAYAKAEKDAFGYVTYMAVSMAGGPRLKELMGAVRWMEKRGKASRTVDRMGKGYAFKLTGRG